MTAWFLAAILSAAFLWRPQSNWIVLIRQMIGKPSPSWTPLTGGVLDVHGTLTLDIMPTEATLGFSKPWYPHAHKTAVEHVIDASEFLSRPRRNSAEL